MATNRPWENQNQGRELGRDGISGMVNKDRAMRAKLLPSRKVRVGR